jgi:hypothetical protein
MLEGRQNQPHAAIEVAGGALPVRSRQLLGAQRMVPAPGDEPQIERGGPPEREVVDGRHPR